MSNDWSCLKGVRIVDVSRLYPGPFASLLLSDFGADVIKVEDLEVGDYVRQMGSQIYEMLNRNKKSVTLNLKSSEGKEIFRKLVERSDAVIEGFRPGVMDKLDLGYDQLKKINPGIVLCSVSGFGQDGPYAQRSGHDLNYLALSGYFAVPSQIEDRVARPKIRLADYAGSMYAALSLAVAIMSARQSGEGQHVDVSIHDAITSCVAPMAIMMDEVWGTDVRRMSHIMPDNDLFRTKDGRFVSLGIMENKFWLDFRNLLGDEFPEIAKSEYDSRPGRMMRKKEVYALLEEVFSSKTLSEWNELLQDTQIPWAPVIEMKEMLSDPHIEYRRTLTEVTDPGTGRSSRQVGFPVKFSKGLDDMRDLPPERGQHTMVILEELGYSEADISKLRHSRVV